MNWAWIKSIWSEPDGQGSSTRIINTAIVSFILGVGTAFTVATFQNKITITQFNDFLRSAGEFILTTSGPLYAANKAADWLKSKNTTGEVNGN